ncbi:unnamed protein product [Pleuronectes platessa]|uniref:Uncharacterized protein n=1 Tax=Pleuronectes platessa TaxID=8262 RepID=A0A9N7TJC1_PLEPL|nr:unnamed protein product [Pleuronectes platessa]
MATDLLHEWCAATKMNEKELVSDSHIKPHDMYEAAIVALWAQAFNYSSVNSSLHSISEWKEDGRQDAQNIRVEEDPGPITRCPIVPGAPFFGFSKASLT